MRSRTGFSGSPVYAYLPPWQPTFIQAPGRKYGNFFYGPWLLGIHSAQIPGQVDAGSAGSGMTAIVPCSALEFLLKKDEKVRRERAAYEARFVGAPAVASEVAKAAADKNPNNKADFMDLPNAAAKKDAPKV